MKRERTVERFFREETKRRGGIALKLVAIPLVGFPDRTIIGPGARIGFAELKKRGGSPDPAQRYWIRKLASFGFPVAVIRTNDEARDFINDVFGGRRK